MKNKILAVIAASITATSYNAVATNGDSLIGLGAISRAMGGTGVAHFAGAESALKKPGITITAKRHRSHVWRNLLCTRCNGH